MSTQILYPKTGLAAPGFAGALVVFSHDTRPWPASLLHAVEWFAIGIPVAVAAAFLWSWRSAAQFKHLWTQRLAFGAALLGSMVGDVGCLGGLYHLFGYVSLDAAKLFLGASVLVVVVWGYVNRLLEGLDEFFHRRGSEGAGTAAAAPPAEDVSPAPPPKS